MADRTGTEPETSVVAELDLLDDWIPEQMQPGMMFLLDQSSEVNQTSNPYWAVLACPKCGFLGLITRRQYEGTESMICDADHCSAEYFLGETAIRYRKPH